jgi:REP element-mobilizing transposase RayT
MGEQVEMDLGKTPKRADDKPKRGGKRRGAGRPRTKGRRRSSERHQTRPRLTRHVPVHVTVRISGRVGDGRRRKLYQALRGAAVLAAGRGLVRIVDVSLQTDHVHLVCEADDRMALARGLQGFLISAARRVNRALGRKGTVFADRYHARRLTCPTDVRNTRLYVLNNFRHHDYFHLRREFDAFSNALDFDGWVDLDIARHRAALPDDERWPAVRPRSWLMTTGWRRCGLISKWELPRS